MTTSTTSNSQIAEKNLAHRETSTRLYGSRLLLARILWGIVVTFALVMLVAALFIYPRFFALASTPCSGNACLPFQLTPASFEALHKLGIPPVVFLILILNLFSFIPASIWTTVGVILVWRKSNDWYVLLVSLWFIIWGVGFATDFGVVPSSAMPVFYIPAIAYDVLYKSLIVPAILLFPNGRLAPRWSIGLVAIWTIAQFPIPFADPLQLLVIVGVGITLIYRYVRILTPVQRQQTKWLVFAILINIGVFWIGWRLLSLAFPAIEAQGSLADTLNGALWAITFLLVPISIGIAMLRYRLWDIDIIINRTLVYGLLTGILAAVYFGLVLSLQTLFSKIGGWGSQSPFIIVGSTLVIAALFQPLRHRIQNIIDRRFYRRKYDARRTVTNFSATLHGEVDLTQLSEQLVTVVEETMQPEHVSLWINKSHQSRSTYYKQDDAPVSAVP